MWVKEHDVRGALAHHRKADVKIACVGIRLVHAPRVDVQAKRRRRTLHITVASVMRCYWRTPRRPSPKLPLLIPRVQTVHLNRRHPIALIVSD